MGILCFLFLSGLLSLSPQEPMGDLNTWKVAVETILLDHDQLPQIDDIQSLARFLKDQGYWEEPVVYDLWGRPYRCRAVV